ncbi:hypothetical protein KJ934_00315 [Patescibacteria group bacterium]|nr:hypothetical protein [Patescibacteria group bacterium]MBU4477460.1 hypothetical protein [Patescibacteria group bacterium]MCG2699130.1 hypothetical protein [Candidatus Parcubacteria bacterium]
MSDILKFQNENSNEEKNQEKCTIEKNKKNLNEILKIKPICKKSCKICNSDHINEIHELRKSGVEFSKIVEICREKFELSTSASSLSNHFANWRERQAIMSAEIVQADLIDEVAKRASHTREIVGLIDTALAQVKLRAASGLIFDVNDLDKLMNIKYKTLAGEPSGEGDLVALFQKAKDKYGMEMSQASLFSIKNKSDAIQ